MLTNKQLWRKQRPMFQGLNLRRSFSDDSVMSGLNTSMDSCTESEVSNRHSSSSFDSISGEGSPESSIKYSKTVEELNLPVATLKKIKKKLRFDNLVRVTLIPSIAEYKDAGLHLFLWCSQNELQCYKDSAYEDIKDFMRESNCENFTQAMKSLFQVENMIEQSRVEASAAAAAASTLAVIAEPQTPEKPTKPAFEPVHAVG